MIGISCHVLDTTRGRPAVGVPVSLERCEASGSWVLVGSGSTNEDGRIGDLLGGQPADEGEYRVRFDTQGYFEGHGTAAFYPRVEVVFLVSSPEHYHIPLLLSPYGYSTYRGS